MRVNLETADVKIGIAVIGYNSIDEIARCLDPWIGHVDVIILGDGRFPQYPGPEYSTDGWMEYAVDRYGESGCLVVTYKLAGEQALKRQKYFDIAGDLGIDFLIVLDTDDYVDPEYSDFDSFYRQLVKLSKIVDDQIFFMWQWIPSPEEWPPQGNRFLPNTWRLSKRIYKNPGNLRYCCHNHYTFCQKDITDEQIYEWQLRRDEADRAYGISVLSRPFLTDHPYLINPRNTIDGVRIKMNRSLRSREQIEAGARWAFLNQHEERFREHCTIQKVMKRKPPEGFESWDAYAKTPHTFNMETGKIILEK